MFKYILLILIVIALIFFMKPVVTEKIQPSMGNKYTTTNVRVNKNQNELKNEMSERNRIITKVIEWQKPRLIKEGNPIVGLIEGFFEIKSWNYYKNIFISDDGRVIDYQRGSVTTSEWFYKYGLSNIISIVVKIVVILLKKGFG